jgi:hypothetical protein
MERKRPVRLSRKLILHLRPLLSMRHSIDERRNYIVINT